ncbi:MAG TPA: ATP-binding protein [Verrucomicrobiae bacterium]|nr:ATP-binding protein [Verrucomicrobiae bacterium]
MSVAGQSSTSNPLNPTLLRVQDLSAICDAMPLAIVSADREGRCRAANKAFGNWFGVADNDLQGRALEEIFGAELYSRMQPQIQAALAGNRRSFGIHMRRDDGSEHSMMVHCIPRVHEEFLEGIHIAMTEIADGKIFQEETRRRNAELEQRVKERTAQLESTNRELEAFCYSVSHDLRAPLRAVRGFSEVLTEQYAEQLDSRGKDFLRRVTDASLQMDNLVEDLLRLSRVSRGEIQNQEIHLSPIAEDILLGLKQAEPSRNVEIFIAPDLRAKGDARLTRLVLDNLLRNAWKFTGKRERARIEFGRSEEPSAAFFVRDNGVGFDMAYVNRLFGVFQRLHSPAEFPGSGVGLAIVQRVINRHGGRVWAEGAVDSGATIYFTLPGNGLS